MEKFFKNQLELSKKKRDHHDKMRARELKKNEDKDCVGDDYFHHEMMRDYYQLQVDLHERIIRKGV